MGWASASHIFNNVASSITAQVSLNEMTQDAAIRVLSRLARSLIDGDWDTVDESYYEFAEYPYVRAALVTAGYEPWAEDDDAH